MEDEGESINIKYDEKFQTFEKFYKRRKGLEEAYLGQRLDFDFKTFLLLKKLYKEIEKQNISTMLKDAKAERIFRTLVEKGIIGLKALEIEERDREPYKLRLLMKR